MHYFMVHIRCKPVYQIVGCSKSITDWGLTFLTTNQKCKLMLHCKFSFTLRLREGQAMLI